MDKKHNSSRDYITFYHEIYTLHPLEMWHTNSLISNFNLKKCEMVSELRTHESKRRKLKFYQKKLQKICIEKHNLT